MGHHMSGREKRRRIDQQRRQRRASEIAQKPKDQRTADEDAFLNRHRQPAHAGR